MTTWTISTGDGRTITSSRQAELREAVSGWFPAMPGPTTAVLLKRLFDSMRAGHVHKAGNAAGLLDLNLAWAPGSTTVTSADWQTAAQWEAYEAEKAAEYLVPVDPADLTQCDGCQ